jgi:putative ABC transport system permease protein
VKAPSGAAPPRIAQALLAVCLPRGMVRDTVVGDLHEAYCSIAERDPTDRALRLRARLWYWSQLPSVCLRYLARRVARILGSRAIASARTATGSKPPRGFIMKDSWNDIRFASRSFRRSPGFTLASVLVLAIGIGAVTLMFSLLNSVVLRPLPFEDPGELVWISSMNQARGVTSNSTAALDYWDYREQSDALESVAALLVFTPQAIITGRDEPERVPSTIVSYNFFATLGIAPQLGRSFLLEEERTGEQNVVVISDGFWQRRLGGDRTAVGASLTINGEPYQVVGVMPQGFNFPNDVDLWFPMQSRVGFTQSRGNNNFNLIGRLAEGVPIEQAQGQLQMIAQRIAEAYPGTNEGWSVQLQSLHERFFAGARSVLLVMLGLVSLVLLIACANVASLALARATTRVSEIAVRFSLGAARGRVIRLLLTESLFVALLGGAVGLALALVGMDALKSLGPATLPRLQELGLDARVLGFAFVLSLITSVLFGVVPALRGTRLSLSDALRVGGVRGSSPAKSGFRNALVITQVALSLMLLIASGLLVRSYSRLQSVDPGFQPQRLLQADVQLPSWKYRSNEEIELAWSLITERVAAIPGVVSVGAIDQQPIRSGGTWNTVYPADRPPASDADRNQSAGDRRMISENYFATMGIPILSGRDFSALDGPNSTLVMIIGQTMAQRFFPDQDPLGNQIVLWGTNWDVVGVAGDVREFGLAADIPNVFYIPARQVGPPRLQFMVRTAGDPTDMAPALREAVWEVDREIPISRFQDMETRIANSLSQPRFRMILVALFAMVAVILAATGLYGVLAYFVRQRTRELGIRVAMGAAPPSIIGLVVRKGMSLVLIGIAAGIAGAFVGARVVSSLLFGVSATDAVTYAGVSLSLVAVGLIACVVPALRAVNVDPQEVLRVE